MVKKHKSKEIKPEWWIIGIIVLILFLLSIKGANNNLLKTITKPTSLFPTPTKSIKISPPPALSTNQAYYVKLATDELAKKLKIKNGEIKVLSVGDKQWNDSSLGCPKKGVMYIQSITSGYQIELSANGKAYIYNAGLNRVVTC